MKDHKITIEILKTLPEAISKALDDGTLPCLSETYKKILALDIEDEYSSQKIIEIILEDYGLISKILYTINSFYYNRWGMEIKSITQSVLLLGCKAIQEIALSMSILELLPKDYSKNMTALVMSEAFLTAHLIKSIASKKHNITQEELFLIALFNHLSRIIIVIYSQPLYEDIIEIEKNGTSEEKGILKNIIKTLGIQIAQKWRLPSSIQQNLEGITADTEEYIKINTAIKKFYSLSNALLSLEKNKIIVMIELIKNEYQLSHDKLIEYINRAISDTAKCSKNFQKIVQQIVKSNIYIEASTLVIPAEEHEKKEQVKSQTREEKFIEILKQLNDAASDDTLSIGHFYLLAIESMYGLLNADNIIFFLLSNDKKELRYKYGIGHDIKSIKLNLTISLPFKNQNINESMTTKKEIICNWHDILTPIKLNALDIENKSICISPIHIADKTIGCFLIDMTENSIFSDIEIKYISTIRQITSIATKLKTTVPNIKRQKP